MSTATNPTTPAWQSCLHLAYERLRFPPKARFPRIPFAVETLDTSRQCQPGQKLELAGLGIKQHHSAVVARQRLFAIFT